MLSFTSLLKAHITNDSKVHIMKKVQDMLNTEEAIKPEGFSPKPTRHKGRNQETRETILEAALQIFTKYPYQNAALRMIGKMARIEHPLISYYYGSKADLFRAVLNRMIKQRLELQKTWFTEVKSMGVDRGFSIFLDNLLEDFRRRPGLFHVVSLNLHQVDLDNPIPGYDLIEEFIKTDVGRMKEYLELEVPDFEAEMFIRAMSSLLIAFLGGANSQAKMMGMEADSIVYYNWVKDTVLFTLLPRLRMMVKKPSPSKN